MDDVSVQLILDRFDSLDRRLDRADESRAALHKGQEATTLRITHIESDLSQLKSRVENAEKVTVAVTTLRTKAEGAGMFGTYTVKVVLAILGFGGWAIGLYTAVANWFRTS